MRWASFFAEETDICVLSICCLFPQISSAEHEVSFQKEKNYMDEAGIHELHLEILEACFLLITQRMYVSQTIKPSSLHSQGASFAIDTFLD